MDRPSGFGELLVLTEKPENRGSIPRGPILLLKVDVF